jgi:hypothetical protein
MATLNIAGAARQWGVSRQTIYNKIGDGILSATKDASGSTEIDPSEMLRVFGEPKQQTDSETDEPLSNGKAGDVLRQRMEIEMLKKEAAEKRANDLEAQMSTLQQQIERLHVREDARDKQLEMALRNVTEALRVALPAPGTQTPQRKGVLERIFKL